MTRPTPPVRPAPPVPQHCPSPRELDDLELLAHGALGRPARFEPEGGLVTLTLPPGVAEEAAAAGAVELVDPEGVPLARVRVEATYPARDRTGVAGEVTALQHAEFGAFRRLSLTPDAVRERHGADTVTVPVTGPLTEPDLARVRALDAPVLLLALTGHGTATYAGRGLSATGLVRVTLAAAELLDRAAVVAVPLASRGPGRAGDDEALTRRVVAAYAPGDVVAVAGEGPLPEAVARVVEHELPPPGGQGLVVLFTGLSGSGKSTLARALHDVVVEQGARTVTSLDGDVVRRHLSAGLTFSREDRETNIRRIGWVAAEISRHRGVAICSPIAPFDRTRREVRSMVEEAGGAFFLVHVATPVAECERRDRKGLYARARRGEIPEFTGVTSPYEEPADADVRVDTTGRGVDEVLAVVVRRLVEAGHLPSATAGSAASPGPGTG